VGFNAINYFKLFQTFCVFTGKVKALSEQTNDLASRVKDLEVFEEHNSLNNQIKSLSEVSGFQ
jgi:hypothetical protein